MAKKSKSTDDISKLVKKSVLLGYGLSLLAQDKASDVTKKIKKELNVNEKEARKMAKDIVKQSKKHQVTAQKHVQSQVSKLVDSLNLATKKDIQDLEKKIKKSRKK